MMLLRMLRMRVRAYSGQAQGVYLLNTIYEYNSLKILPSCTPLPVIPGLSAGTRGVSASAAVDHPSEGAGACFWAPPAPSGSAAAA